MKSTVSLKLAERYVSALFEVAKSASALGPVEKDLTALAGVARTNDAFARFLANPLLTRKQQSDIVAAMLTNIGAHDITRQFCAMLARQRRLPALVAVAERFAQRASLARGELAAELISARELKSSEISGIESKLSKYYGKKIAIRTRVDRNILGGLMIRIGSQQLDGSVAGKLQRLGLKLKEVA
jgi:F-type H+-transporting ATPase subunit delta